MMRTLKGDHERFEKTYFSTFEGKYFTGRASTQRMSSDTVM